MYSKFSLLKKYSLPFYLPTSTSALLSRRQALSWLYVLFFCHTCLWVILGLFLGSFDISFILLSIVWFWFWAPVCLFFCIVFLISELFFFFDFVTYVSSFLIIGGAPLLVSKFFLLLCCLYLFSYGLKIILRLLFLLLTNSLRMIGFCFFIFIYLFWYFFRYDLGFLILSVIFEIIYEFFIVIYFFLISILNPLLKPLSKIAKKSTAFLLNFLVRFIIFLNEKKIINLTKKFNISLTKRLLKYSLFMRKRDINISHTFRIYTGVKESHLYYNEISSEELKKMREDARRLRNLYIELKNKKSHVITTNKFKINI